MIPIDQSPDWTKHPGTAYRLPVCLLQEPDGGFSVIAATLRGVASQGDTEAEALANIREALSAALAEYAAQGMPPPWCHAVSRPTGKAEIRWVVVHIGGQS